MNIPWQEKAWRWFVSTLFGARIACFWFDHPEEQCTTGTSYNGRSFHCAACGHESFREWPE